MTTRRILLASLRRLGAFRLSLCAESADEVEQGAVVAEALELVAYQRGDPREHRRRTACDVRE